LRNSNYILVILISIILLINIFPNFGSIKIHKNNSNEINNIYIKQKVHEIIKTINESMIENILRELISIGPRMTSTYGCQKAGEYIINKFNKYNLSVEKRPWEDFGNKFNPGYYKSNNIIGTKQGLDKKDDEVIIFHAHYDTVKDSVGANDDGSGVVGVLAAAYALSKYDFNKTIKFVTFSGEEIGLCGSSYYAKEIYDENLDILVAINADMIGKSNTKEEGKKIRLSYSEDTEWIINAIDKINKSNEKIDIRVSEKYPYDRDSDKGYSDYFGLIRYGYESISVWNSGNDPYANTPEDVFSNVNISYLVNTTRIIAATIAYLADNNNQPPKVTIGCPKKGKIYHQDKIIKNLKTDKTFVINDIWIYPDIKIYNSDIKKIEFYYDGILQETINDIPYAWHLNKNSIGKHKIEVKVYDTLGRTSIDQINIFNFNLLKTK